MAKMLDSHIPAKRTTSGHMPKKTNTRATSIYNYEFRQRLFRAADQILNKQPRPRA